MVPGPLIWFAFELLVVRPCLRILTAALGLLALGARRRRGILDGLAAMTMVQSSGQGTYDEGVMQTRVAVTSSLTGDVGPCAEKMRLQ